MLVMNPASERALRGAPVAVLDFETTGPDPEEAQPVQVAVVHTALGEDEPKVVYKALIQPGCPISPGAAAVHGITEAMVADATPWVDAVPELLPYLEGRALAAYNLPFDWLILSRGIAAAGLDPAALPFGALDPLVWVKVAQRYERGKRLEQVCERLGVHLDAHDAAGDALATAQIMPMLLHTLGRHKECGRDPLLSVGAMWAWTKNAGQREERGFAAWRAKQGQAAPRMLWAELAGDAV